MIRSLARHVIDRAAALVGPAAKRTLGKSDLARRLVRWARATHDTPPASVTIDTDLVTENPSAVLIPIELIGNVPSYRYKLEELKRRHASMGAAFGLKDPLDSINDKYRAYTFADRYGIDHPKLIGAFGSVDHVEWAELPKRFVLKTRWGSSNHGVKALVREGPATFYDLLRSRTWTVEEIVDHHHRMEAQGTVSKTMFAEELILKPGTNHIADDWKFYCFDGVVGLCMQRDVRATGDQSQWRFKFWDSDWNDMGPIKFADRLDPDLAPPEDPAALLELAERLSSIIRRPFVRIDLFESERGPVLGEFTPRPGPPEVFVPQVDEMLGRLWEEAEQRLFAREIADGVWNHILIE